MSATPAILSTKRFVGAAFRRHLGFRSRFSIFIFPIAFPISCLPIKICVIPTELPKCPSFARFEARRRTRGRDSGYQQRRSQFDGTARPSHFPFSLFTFYNLSTEVHP
jgi:hypothetical protein